MRINQELEVRNQNTAAFCLLPSAFCLLLSAFSVLLSTFYLPRSLKAQDPGTLALLYAAPVSAATCTSGTTTLTLGSVPANLVTGAGLAVTGMSPAGWNGNFTNVTVSGSNVSYSQTCPGSNYVSGGYAAATIPGINATEYVIDVPGHIRLAVGSAPGTCPTTTQCEYLKNLSDFWDNKNDTEFDVTGASVSGSTVTLTLSGSPTWSVGQPISVFGSSLASGTFTSNASINGGYLITAINGNQVTYSLNNGVSCTGSCTFAGGFAYQVDVSSMDSGLAQMQFGIVNAPQSLSSTNGGGASLGADGKTVTLTLANSGATMTSAAGQALTVTGISLDTGSCNFSAANKGIQSVSAGQVVYQLSSAQSYPCTGHGGTVTANRFSEYKNSPNAAITVLENNNVRIRLQQTWQLRQYGNWNGGSAGIDCCITGTEYLTFYRPDKVFQRWDMTYNNADNAGPLTFGMGGISSDATTQLSAVKSQNFANTNDEVNQGACGNEALIAPPWQQVWQGYMRYYAAKTWLMFTPNHASWSGTVNIGSNGTSVTLASGDNFAAGMPLASWSNALVTLWTASGNAVQTTVSSITNGSDYTGGTTLTLNSGAFASTSGVNFYVGNLPPFDFGSTSNCGASAPSAVGVQVPDPGNLHICATGPAASPTAAAGCPLPGTFGTTLSGVVHANYLRILGDSPALGASPATGSYLANSTLAQWFEGTRVRMQGAYYNAPLPGDGTPHTILYTTLRLGDDGLWQGSASNPRLATQAVAGAYAAEYEAAPAPSFNSGGGSCTGGFPATCFDQGSGAYQITAASGAVSFSLSLPGWQSSHTYKLGAAIWDGTNVEVATFVNTSSGSSGGSQPHWSSNCPNLGNVCTDNNVTWYNAGPRYFHYPAFEIAGWTHVPATLTVNSTAYNLNTDYVAAVNAGGVIVQLLKGDAGTAGMYASLAVQGSTGSSSYSTASGNGTSVVGMCGPPSYCARTDLSVQQESPLPFTVGPQGYTNFPANTVFMDPDFGERIVRITDNNTLPSAGCFGASYNTNLTEGGNPDDNVFSSDSKWFRAVDLQGFYWLFSFNPATMQAGCVRVTGSSSGALPLGGAEFGRSLADAGIIYGVPSGATWFPGLQSYNANTGVTATVVDFRTCSGLSWLSSFSHAPLGWSTTANLSRDDDYIGAAFGPQQNEGWLAAFYQQSTGKCGWVDLRTGQVGGNLWPGTTQLSGAFPLNFGTNGGPSVPTATATTGGSLTTGHQYAVQYSLVYETTVNGMGESAASPVQYVTLSGSNNAISIPSPAASANDSVPWSHYNIYACDNTATPGCTPTLQPAANLGCSMAAPNLSVVPNTTGSTSYTYTEEAVGKTCTTWDTVTISNGAAVPNITVTPGAVTGAYFYRVIKGAWISGTATVDQAVMPEQLSYVTSSSPTGANVTDTGQGGTLTATGTISCNASYTWMPTPNPLYTCNNGATLTAISSGGPPAPTVSTLGIFLHEMFLAPSGNWLYWSSEQLGGSAVYWQLGNVAGQWCNMSSAWENPPNSYVSCIGHSVLGLNGVIFNGGTTQDSGYFYNQDYRPFTGLHTLSTGSQCTASPTRDCYLMTTFPAIVPPWGTYPNVPHFDQHQSWNFTSSGLHSDMASPYIWSTDASAGAAAPQTAISIDRGWAREIDATNPLTGVVYRFAHHRSSGTAYYSPNCSTAPKCESSFYHNAITAVSEDGKFAMFTSDMEWLLGCRPTYSCTYNSSGQVTSGEARADVFIVELK